MPSMPEPVAEPREALLSQRQIFAIFGALMLGILLAALDQTIVATSIRTIADDLQGLSLQAWATTAYLITATISTPLYGKLSDIFGRRRLFLIAISIFIIGSLACSFAQSMYELAAFRAVQGLGAGGLFAMALAIIGDIVAPRERAKYQGYFVAVFATSSVLGPLAGGFLAGQAEILGVTGWRWVFLVNVPIGIIALYVVFRVLNIPHAPRPHRIDYRGAIALAITLVPLLIVAEQGRTWGWWSGSAIVCYAIGAVGLVLFLSTERRMGEDALLPLRFFRNRVFGPGSVAVLIVGVGMFGGIAALPLYLQIVKGATPTQAGLLTLPLVLGIMAMSVGSGQVISRTGRYKIWPIVGVSLMIVALLLLTTVGVDTPFWVVATYMVIFGMGLGGNMQPLILAIQNAMPIKDLGVATSSATFFRQMGGALGTAVFLSVLFSTVQDRIAGAFRAAAGTPEFRAAVTDPAVLADPTNRAVIGALQDGGATGGSGVLQDSSFLSQLDPRLARPFLVGFAESMNLVFAVGAAVLVIGLIAVILMPEVPLRTESGIEAQRTEDAEAAAAVAAAAPVAPVAPAAVGEPVTSADHVERRGGR